MGQVIKFEKRRAPPKRVILQHDDGGADVVGAAIVGMSIISMVMLLAAAAWVSNLSR